MAKLLSRVPVLNWFENAGMVSMLLILLVAVNYVVSKLNEGEGL